MAEVFSLQNTFGAGQRQKSLLESATQNREFNSLRISGERQRQDLQQRTFDADQQQANTLKLLNGVRLAQENPSLLPQVGQELVSAGILNEAELPGMLQRAQTDPESFMKGLEDFESQLMFALSEAPQEQKFGAQTVGIDPTTGERAFGQANQQTGDFRINEGLTPPTGGGNVRSDFFNELTSDLSEDDVLSSKRIQLGLEPRAVGSADITIAEDDELTEDVADSKATIAQRRKFGELTGASRAKVIDKGVESIQKIDVNNRNLDKAIAAIDEGAKTGAIISRFTPTIRASTVKLEQIQKLLGLDVIGAVTFGALSKGELDLALETALPTNLSTPELKQWLLDKQAANNKLRDYFSAQIEFVDTGGTLAGFLRQQERGTNTEELDPALLEFMTPEEQALFQ